ncbi:MAG: GAF domain-containing protein, partial [Planctomycetes bacterium]|nr:GAF domain-containing protein [Planctomycetota bacterium]
MTDRRSGQAGPKPDTFYDADSSRRVVEDSADDRRVLTATHSLGQLLQRTLDEVRRLSRSRHAFFYCVDADRRVLALQAWSSDTSGEGDAQPVHESIETDKAGVLADCLRQRLRLIVNEGDPLPPGDGFKQCHVQAKRMLAIPVVRDEDGVAILVVADKATDYTDGDADTAVYFADVAWEIADRKRTEGESKYLLQAIE